MAIRSGLAAQFMFAEEGTVGTGVTPNKTLPIISASIDHEIEPIVSDAIYPGRTVAVSEQVNQGAESIKIGIQSELYAKGGIGLLLKHAFGAIATTGSGPYTHTFNFGDLYGLGLTAQVGVPGVGGTVRPFTVAGCKVEQLEIAWEAEQGVTMAADFLGMTITKGTALASPSVGTGRPFTFKHASATIGGSAIPVRSGKITVANKFAERRFGGQATTSEPVQNDLREVTGELGIEFTDFTQYDRFTGGAEAAVVMVFDNGTETLTFTGNAWFNANAPGVDGRDIVTQALPVMFDASTSNDYSALRPVLVNSESGVT